MNIFENENGHLVYEIESLDDFLKIPADRLEDCLADFKVATDMMRHLHQAAQEVSNNPTIYRKFKWIDDGIHGGASEQSVRFTVVGIEPEGDDMILVQLSNGSFDDEETD